MKINVFQIKRISCHVGTGILRSSYRNQKRPEKLFPFPKKNYGRRLCHVSIQYVRPALHQPGERRSSRKKGEKDPPTQRAHRCHDNHRQAVWTNGNFQGGLSYRNSIASSTIGNILNELLKSTIRNKKKAAKVVFPSFFKAQIQSG